MWTTLLAFFQTHFQMASLVSPWARTKLSDLGLFIGPHDLYLLNSIMDSRSVKFTIAATWLALLLSIIVFIRQWTGRTSLIDVGLYIFVFIFNLSALLIYQTDISTKFDKAETQTFSTGPSLLVLGLVSSLFGMVLSIVRPSQPTYNSLLGDGAK